MSLSVQSRPVGEVIVVKCTGRIIEGQESTTLEQHVTRLLPDDPHIVLDLAAVEFVDSGGVGLLVRLLNRTRAAHGDLKLCAIPPRIQKVLQLTRLSAEFDAHDSEGNAIAAFYRGPKPSGERERFGTEILCIEQAADVQAYVCGVLKQAGYGVMSSTNLSDAIVLLKASRPRVVIVDGSMRAPRGGRIADALKGLVDERSVIELPPEFANRDPAESGPELLARVRAAMGESV